jgi:hypothetical protein
MLSVPELSQVSDRIQILSVPKLSLSIVGGLMHTAPNQNAAVVAAYNLPITLQFRVEGADRPCEGYINGMLAQEKITERWVRPPMLPDRNPFEEWSPNAAAPAFKLVGNVIHDVKAQPNMTEAAFSQIPIGKNYAGLTQALRLKYKDACGNWQTINLGSVKLGRQRFSDAHWRLVVDPVRD